MDGWIDSTDYVMHTDRPTDRPTDDGALLCFMRWPHINPSIDPSTNQSINPSIGEPIKTGPAFRRLSNTGSTPQHPGPFSSQTLPNHLQRGKGSQQHHHRDSLAAAVILQRVLDAAPDLSSLAPPMAPPLLHDDGYEFDDHDDDGSGAGWLRR